MGCRKTAPGGLQPRIFSFIPNNYSFDSNKKYKTGFEIFHQFLCFFYETKYVLQKKVKIYERISKSVSEKYEKIWNPF